MRGVHDVFAAVTARGKSEQDRRFGIGVAKEGSLSAFARFFSKIIREKQAQNIVRLGIGVGALTDELVTPLRIRISNVAWHSKNVFALI